MTFTDVFPLTGIGKVDQGFSQLDLNAKSQLLRDKIKLLRQSSKAPQETLHQIDSHLNAIAQEPNLIRQWNHYELAYEGFIATAGLDDLLGVMLNLRARTQILDPTAQQIWSKLKLEQLEEQVRAGTANGAIREEIASLARAIYERALRFVRNSSLRARVLKTALFLNVALSLAVITLLWYFQLKQIPSDSAWQTPLIGCLGACGALLRATIQVRQSQWEMEDLKMQPAVLLFRAAFGAVLALAVTLFLRLRVIDFPYLHTGAPDLTPLTPAVLYIFAFLSGFGEQTIFTKLERRARKTTSTLGARQAEDDNGS
jgi:hypothetical protein